MKTSSSIRALLALLVLSAVLALTNTNAEAGDRRGTASPPPQNSGGGQAISLP